ncbi:MAG: DUF2975 domain-containing protein [Oscillospiraceae bacterium]|nr:DUF2975 domain-containing protein [Oscillospiraceae bacterium]
MKLIKALHIFFWFAFGACLAAIACLPLAASRLLGGLYVYPPTAAFLGLCGACAAFVIWQGKTVLGNLSRGIAFAESNARCARRASYSCFVVSAAAFIRMLIHLYDGKPLGMVLLEYNTLFIAAAAVAGLLGLVVAGLFSAAAGMKRDNDLVI